MYEVVGFVMKDGSRGILPEGIIVNNNEEAEEIFKEAKIEHYLYYLRELD